MFTDMRTREGFPLTQAKLEPRSIVGIPGIGQMELRHALNAGFVMQNQDGTYSKGTGTRQPVKQEIHPDLREEKITGKTGEAFESIESGTMPTTQAMAIHEVASKGDLSAITLSQLAADMGVERHQMTELVGSVRAGFEQQARAAIAETGMDTEKVLEWAYANRPRQMQEAIKRQLHKRGADGYRSIANEYLQNLDTIDPDMILNGPTRRRHHGPQGARARSS